MNGNTSFLWEKVEKAVVDLPEVYQQLCHGTPAFYTEKKLFTRLWEDGTTLVVYNNDRDEWIASNPDIFFITNHYKNYPMLLVDLKTVSIQDLQELLISSWKIRAPKKLLKVYLK